MKEEEATEQSPDGSMETEASEKGRLSHWPVQKEEEKKIQR